MVDISCKKNQEVMSTHTGLNEAIRGKIQQTKKSSIVGDGCVKIERKNRRVECYFSSAQRSKSTN